jgi:hypothetical protein
MNNQKYEEARGRLEAVADVYDQLTAYERLALMVARGVCNRWAPGEAELLMLYAWEVAKRRTVNLQDEIRKELVLARWLAGPDDEEDAL